MLARLRHSHKQRTSSEASFCSAAASGTSPAGGGGSSTAVAALLAAPDSSPLAHLVRLALRPSPAAATLRRRAAAAVAAAVPLGAAVRLHRAADGTFMVVRAAAALLGAWAALRPVAGTAGSAICAETAANDICGFAMSCKGNGRPNAWLVCVGQTAPAVVAPRRHGARLLQALARAVAFQPSVAYIDTAPGP